MPTRRPIQYPVFTLVSGVERDESGAIEGIENFLYVESEGQKCLAVFSARFLADGWRAAKTGTLVNAIHDAEAFRDLLRIVESCGLHFVAWDAPGLEPFVERVMPMSEVFTWIDSD